MGSEGKTPKYPYEINSQLLKIITDDICDKTSKVWHNGLLEKPPKPRIAANNNGTNKNSPIPNLYEWIAGEDFYTVEGAWENTCAGRRSARLQRPFKKSIEPLRLVQSLLDIYTATKNLNPSPNLTQKRRTRENPSFCRSVLLSVMVLLDGVCGVCGGDRRRGTGGGCWWHWLVVFVVTLVSGVCGGYRWCQYSWCLWHWLVVFVVVVTVGKTCLPKEKKVKVDQRLREIRRSFLNILSQENKVKLRRDIKNIERGGQGSVDADKENKSEKEEKLESEKKKDKEKEDDHQHDDNRSPMGRELISTSQHDSVKTFSIDKGHPCLFPNEDGIWFSQAQDQAWEFEVIPSLRKQVMDNPNEVSHPRMFRWLAAKSNTKIKKIDLLNPLDDIVMLILLADPTVELIRKELARETAIRKAVRQGQPNVESLHDQPTKVDPGASSCRVVGVGGRHADATTTRDDEHVDAQESIPFHPYKGSSHPSSHSYSRCEYKECKDSQDKLFQKVEAISKDVEEFKSKKGVRLAVEVQESFKKVDIYVELGTNEKRDLRQAKNAKPGAPDYPRPLPPTPPRLLDYDRYAYVVQRQGKITFLYLAF
ncbi:hypothetical protein FXO38_29022 [Capsicum annuum]|nr:hypothetical protein FXO38_29022 [Capsicum annuum]KAF3653856.1 hypothetical protein FXO37_16755 [Capsicum annuum]